MHTETAQQEPNTRAGLATQHPCDTVHTGVCPPHLLCLPELYLQLHHFPLSNWRRAMLPSGDSVGCKAFRRVLWGSGARRRQARDTRSRARSERSSLTAHDNKRRGSLQAPEAFQNV